MCQEKILLTQFGEEVVLCCDDHLNNSYHYDKLHNLEWRVPGAAVLSETSPPPKRMRNRVICNAG